MDLDILQKHKFQFIHFAYVYHTKKGDTGNPQLNNNSHIMHICKGQATCYIAGDSFTAKAGDVIATPSFTPVTMVRTDDFEMMNLHYNIWLDDGTLLDEIKRLPLIFTPSYFQWCYEKLSEIKEIILHKPLVKLPDAIAYEIILRHLTENPVIDVESSVSDLRMQKVKQNLEDPKKIKFDSGELAALCSLSKNRMNRKFRDEFGISPQKYWEKQRLKNICIALRKSSASINEISNRWGFETNGYFWRWFKKMTNCTPTQYRKQVDKE